MPRSSVREQEREKLCEKVKERDRESVYDVCVCEREWVCACVLMWKRESKGKCVFECVWVCECFVSVCLGGSVCKCVLVWEDCVSMCMRVKEIKCVYLWERKSVCVAGVYVCEWMRVRMCVCVKERARESESVCAWIRMPLHVSKYLWAFKIDRSILCIKERVISSSAKKPKDLYRRRIKKFQIVRQCRWHLDKLLLRHFNFPDAWVHFELLCSVQWKFFYHWRPLDIFFYEGCSFIFGVRWGAIHFNKQQYSYSKHCAQNSFRNISEELLFRPRGAGCEAQTLCL